MIPVKGLASLYYRGHGIGKPVYYRVSSSRSDALRTPTDKTPKDAVPDHGFTVFFEELLKSPTLHSKISSVYNTSKHKSYIAE